METKFHASMFSHLHKYHNETKYFEPKCALFSKNANFCIRSRDNGGALVTSQSEPTGHLVASHAGVFRGARFSSLPTNACSTEDNIPRKTKFSVNQPIFCQGNGFVQASITIAILTANFFLLQIKNPLALVLEVTWGTDRLEAEHCLNATLSVAKAVYATHWTRL